MSKESVYETIAGTIGGMVGGVINKHIVGLKLVIIMNYFPHLQELVSNGVMAAFCAGIGFFTTKFCRFIYLKIKKKWFA